MLKEQARQLQGDFIPGGRKIGLAELSTVEFRRTTDNEVFRCCYRVGYDPQSGAIYCGDIAEWIAFLDNGTRAVGLCGAVSHSPAAVKSMDESCE